MTPIPRNPMPRPPITEPAGTAHLDRYAISESTYQWTARAFGIVKKMLSVNLELHHDAGQLAEGDIFLFNHFARFETFIPQYFLYEKLGIHSRAVASAEFFVEDDALGRYLRSVGAVPNDMPGLLPFLAAEIIRGRKVVVFPEGGMVKDRHVVDPDGGLSVYSRTAGERRKHHSGPAVLALVLDTFKNEVRRLHAAGNVGRIEEWANGLGLSSGEDLVRAAAYPTRIVPCNITFYPIRVDENLLSRAADLVSRGLSRRMAEELLVEGNILLRDTDMDIRLGDVVDASSHWGSWERRLMARLARKFTTLDDFFHASRDSGGWERRVLKSRVRTRVYAIRDEYMWHMYQSVTINLSHLASSLVLTLVDGGRQSILLSDFQAMLYEVVKRVQTEKSLHVHGGLSNPNGYAGLIDGRCVGFEQFIGAKSAMQLIRVGGDTLEFTERLRQEHDFDDVRLNNLIVVYANEVAPIQPVCHHIRAVVEGGTSITSKARQAAHQFDDELRRFALDKLKFSASQYSEINKRETATLSGAPYLLHAKGAQRKTDDVAPLGVVMVHGFLSSPAELRGLGDALHAAGLPVIGVRLRGHGTSPWDLSTRTLDDWVGSVRQGQRIMAGLAERHVVVGFSMGGSLAIIRAAEPEFGLSGAVAINVPAGFEDSRMKLVPLVHGANAVIGMVTGTDGVVPFRPNNSENSHINYASIPMSSLSELAGSASVVKAAARGVAVPTLVIQATSDPVVSADVVRDMVATMPTELTDMVDIDSDVHGIVYADVGETWTNVKEFVMRIAKSPILPASDLPA